jgi:hypothetical protein
VSRLVEPDSPQAADIVEAFWTPQAEARSAWTLETTYR